MDFNTEITEQPAGRKIARYNDQLPLNTYVKLYGSVSPAFAGKVLVIKGWHRNSRGIVLTVLTPSMRDPQIVQCYEDKTGIAEYQDQAAAEVAFKSRHAAYMAAFETQNWTVTKALKELYG